MNDAWQRKIDHRLRALWGRVPETGRAQSVNVLLRFTGSAEELRRQGVALRSLAGDIAAATITLAELPRIAGLPAVTTIELARVLGPDAPDAA